MANPQLEDGHTQIANEILEQLAKLYLSPNQWQAIIFIIRKTYGFHKKVDYIANFQIAEGTGLNKHVISRILRILEERNIIHRNKKLIGFQKDWEQWLLPKQVTLGIKLPEQITNESYQNRQPELPKQVTELPKQVTKVTRPRDTQKIKDTITKDTIQKKETPPKKQYGEFNNVFLIDEEYQKLIIKSGEATTKQWIETLSTYIASKGSKYKSHYATILNWQRREEATHGTTADKGHPESRISPRDRSHPPEFYAQEREERERMYAAIDTERSDKERAGRMATEQGAGAGTRPDGGEDRPG